LSEQNRAVFDGIVRDDGRVATRNYIGVLPSVACSSSVCRYIADGLNEEILSAYPNVDGIVGLTQNSGCGMASYGPGFENLQRSLAGYAKHPNFWGVLFVGLGCEVNQLDLLFDSNGLTLSAKLRTLSIQDTGGTEATIIRGVEILKEMLPAANQVKRQPVSSSHLILGLECGGSDAFSGITANPALGVAADLLVRNGGTVILSETTEIYGAEQLLIQRANCQEIAKKLIALLHWWEAYTKINGAMINNNPTPGNKAGGLTTILEKSLGAVAKAGSTPLMEVYRYAESVRAKGLVFMDTPGYDLASVTGMVAGGANIICFTTGCGTVLGIKPAPVIKLASNTEMFQRLSADMDMDCGLITQGKQTIEEAGAAIFQKILDTASGQKTKSEAFGYGDNEFVPWNIGAVL
jgi:altronate hydrolase